MILYPGGWIGAMVILWLVLVLVVEMLDWYTAECLYLFMGEGEGLGVGGGFGEDFLVLWVFVGGWVGWLDGMADEGELRNEWLGWGRGGKGRGGEGDRLCGGSCWDVRFVRGVFEKALEIRIPGKAQDVIVQLVIRRCWANDFLV